MSKREKIGWGMMIIGIVLVVILQPKISIVWGLVLMAFGMTQVMVANTKPTRLEKKEQNV